ncbi:NUDIX hydrolase [Heyndrickxia oleronia]|uniref:NUDIX hydrolase n=1 Tax=Heyndrickxia oleronia TaxID=38875 RepID=UPI001C0ECA90|nr:NUDIX domain-containing protein [Heyndrickxia oleronia]MBU5213903.1 NUDIX domain-containing protein [Heyndrickxia oleronia]
MAVITFGQKEDAKQYIKRPAVYCLMFNKQKDRIAIIKTGDGKYFLPGGGIENNETHEGCIKREALEEMGMEIELGHFIGCAQRYFFSTNEYKCYLSEGYFYLCEMGKQVSEPTVWVEPIRAVENLFHEHQIWAVHEALKLI